MKRLILISIIVVGIGVMVTLPAHAAFRVENTGRIVYYANIYCAFAYTLADTARIVVLFGPEMTLEKFVRNEVSFDSSTSQVPCNRGDTITILLYASNDQSNADTAAWHVIISDSFTRFVGIDGKDASVGPDEVNDSFTYVPGSETTCREVEGESVVLPDSVTYWLDGNATWEGDFDTNTQQLTGTWQKWSDAGKEVAGAGAAKNIVGIKWYWWRVPSKQYYNQSVSAMDSTGMGYKTQLKFQVKKNNN